MMELMPYADDLASALQDAFDEWLFRMHGVTSSCDHQSEAQGALYAITPVLMRMVAEAKAGGRTEVAEAVRAAIGHANGPEAVELEDRVIAALDGAA